MSDYVHMILKISLILVPALIFLFSHQVPLLQKIFDFPSIKALLARPNFKALFDSLNGGESPNKLEYYLSIDLIYWCSHWPLLSPRLPRDSWCAARLLCPLGAPQRLWRVRDLANPFICFLFETESSVSVC